MFPSMASSFASSSEMLDLLRRIAEDTRHIHNLQHGVVQGILNTVLYQEYKALGPDKIAEFMYDEVLIKMYLPRGVFDLIEQSILQYRSFFHYDSLEMTRHLIPMKGDVVLDIGAHIGNHTVYYAKICGASKIHSFEPIPPSFRALTKNIEINDIDAVPYNFALGLTSQHARADVNSSNLGGSSLITDEQGSITVRPLDSLNLPDFSFMKIDVEGMAPELLLGATETITKYRPRIVVEAFPHEFERINGILEELGYAQQAKVADDFVYFPVPAKSSGTLTPNEMVSTNGFGSTIAAWDNTADRRGALINERDQARIERDAAIDERDRAMRERDAAIEERDRAAREQAAAIAELDRALRERDAAIDERDKFAEDSRRWYEASTARASELGLHTRRPDGAGRGLSRSRLTVWHPVSRRAGRRSAIEMARQAAVARNWELAVRYYSDAVSHAPHNAALWVQYGHALKEAKSFEAAESSYRNALEYDPRIADTHLQIGHLLALRKRTAEATDSYVRALQLRPQLQDARYSLHLLGWTAAQIDRMLHGTSLPLTATSAADASPGDQ
jgi:FkbM family methyltransferase